jgi:hypothetical protein
MDRLMGSGPVTDPPKMRFYHLRFASVIGCSAHGPFGRDMSDDCQTCLAVKEARSWSRRGRFGVLSGEALRSILSIGTPADP